MLNNQLETLRQQANLTYKQLAQKCNVSESTISRIFSGETAEPAFSTISAIVIACGGSLDELVGIREVGETKSPIETLREEYENRIRCIKAENQEYVKELIGNMTTQREESAHREEVLNRSSDHKMYFVIAATALLMVAQGVVDIFLFSSLL
jgi:transcriptional regulator with XRE-family HTH domain